MSKVKSFEEYKSEMIGKTFGWLTVLDVFRDDRNNRVCKCQCKCGNIVIKDMRKVYNGHTTSCGCYAHSKEKSDNLKRVWKDNYDKRLAQSYKLKQYYKDNQELAKRLGENISNWYKENYNKAKEKAGRFSEWCKEHQEEVKSLGKKHSQFYKDHPEIGKIAGDKLSRWCKENPDKVKARTDKRSKTLEENPDIQKNISIKNAIWRANNPNKLKDIADSNSRFYKLLRASADYSLIIDSVHPSQVDDLLSGNILSTDLVKVKCPVCGEYSGHTLHNFFNIKSGALRSHALPMCNSCYNSFVIINSKYEQEISDYISTFYNGDLIKNDRFILNGKELDLYYPEKKIAIEFNGDYWHSSEFKNEDYHYNKFKQCRDLGITLVSIFESQWISKRDDIVSYLKDLFNGKNNKLSFIDNYYMNNNYPALYISITSEFIPSSYKFRDALVSMCGYSKIEI